MGNGYPVVQPDELADLRAKIQSAFTKIRELERPTGTQLSDAVATLQDLVNGLLNQVNVVATGSVTAGTYVSAGTNFTASNGTLVSPYARSHSVVTSYVAAYIDGSGNFLSTPSSLRMKRDIRTATWTREQRDKIRSVFYRLRAAYILADMQGQDTNTVETLPGVIGEELLEAGLPEFVVLDSRGRVFTVRYELLALVAIDGLQQVEAQMDALRADVAELRAETRA